MGGMIGCECSRTLRKRGRTSQFFVRSIVGCRYKLATSWNLPHLHAQVVTIH